MAVFLERIFGVSESPVRYFSIVIEINLNLNIDLYLPLRLLTVSVAAAFHFSILGCGLDKGSLLIGVAFSSDESTTALVPRGGAACDEG